MSPGGAAVELGAALVLTGIGAVSYGLSLLCYLRSLALVGAARTGGSGAAPSSAGRLSRGRSGAPWTGIAFAGAAALMIAGGGCMLRNGTSIAGVTSRPATGTFTAR